MKTLTPHGIAGQMVKKRLPDMVLMTILQLLLRLLALSPLLAALSGVTLGIDSQYVLLYALGASALLYLLLPLPLRFLSRGRLARFARELPAQKIRYGLWLKLGLARFFKAFLWMLPAMVCAGGLYYLWNVADATQLVKVIRWLASLVGGSYLHGTLMLMAIFLLSLPLAYFGWRRHLALEFLPEEELIHSPFTRNREMMRQYKAPLGKATRVNLLICLPAILAVFIILAMDIAPKMRGSLTGDLLMVLETVNKMAFSSGAFTQVLIALAVLYLPFVLYRKAALAAVLTSADERA